MVNVFDEDDFNDDDEDESIEGDEDETNYKLEGWVSSCIKLLFCIH